MDFYVAFISAICSQWPKSGTAKCITSRPTFNSGTARAVSLRYVPTPLRMHRHVARVFRIRSIWRLSVVSFAIAKLRNHLEMVRPL